MTHPVHYSRPQKLREADEAREAYNRKVKDDLRFTPAVLVTGQDERENEFFWWYSDGKYIDGYNECEITETEFRKIYPLVGKVYFSDVVMTGDQWRDMQCPLSLSNVQIEAWLNEKHAVDAAQAVEREIDANTEWKIYKELKDRHADWLDEQRTLQEAGM